MPKQFVDLEGAELLYDDLRPRAASADGNLAPAYTQQAYALGDLVMHEDK